MEGMEKSSCGVLGVVVGCVWVPLTITASGFGDDDDAGLFHSGCGSRPMMLSLPVPALAHSHIPRRGYDSWLTPYIAALLPPSASRGCG